MNILIILPFIFMILMIFSVGYTFGYAKGWQDSFREHEKHDREMIIDDIETEKAVDDIFNKLPIEEKLRSNKDYSDI